MYSVCVYIVVSYNDFIVLSMSVMGFQKKFGWWVGGFGVSSIQYYFGFLAFFKLCKAPKSGYFTNVVIKSL